MSYYDSVLFNVDINNYNGPLDVLLDLAKAQKVDLEIATVLAVWIHGKLSHNSDNVIVEDFIKEIPKVVQTINNN